MPGLPALIEGAGRIVVSGHARPDGDALGAALALGRCLAAAGRDAIVAGRPEELGAAGFLDGCAALVRPEEAASGASLLVAVDCGDVERLPEPLRPLSGRIEVVNIDHHPTNARFGTWNWVDPAASSCGEMVWRLVRRAGWPLDRSAAEALWVAVVTDTGRFAYDSTRPATLRCAADLLRCGVRTSWINDRLYGQFERRVLELRRRAYDTLEVWAGGLVACVTLTARDFAETGCSRADAEDVVDIPRSLRGSLGSLFFYEAGEPGTTRVSIRARPPLDATVLAMPFGGGGHRGAAGCTVDAPLADAKRLLFAAVGDWLRSPKEATCESGS
jgi:phosphoesterase RecJ-like protein